MIKRKKRLRLIQLSLLIIGTFVIYFTYSDKNRLSKEKLVPIAAQEKIKKQLFEETQDGDIFYNIDHNTVTQGTALYEDVYVKIDGQWLIKHSEYDRIWEQVSPISPDIEFTKILLKDKGIQKGEMK